MQKIEDLTKSKFLHRNTPKIKLFLISEKNIGVRRTLSVQGFVTSLERRKHSLLITPWTDQNQWEGMKMESIGIRFSPTDISHRKFPTFANVKPPLSILTKSTEIFLGLQ